jgi:outer membrane protein assembly factor BamB
MTWFGAALLLTLHSCRRSGEGSGDVPVPRGEDVATASAEVAAFPGGSPAAAESVRAAPAEPPDAPGGETTRGGVPGEAEAVDADALPPADVVWRRDAEDTTPIRVETPDGPAALLFEADGGAILVDGGTGEPRWRRMPADGDRWYGAAFAADALIVHGGSADDRMTVQRLEVASGNPIWRTVLHDGYSVEPAALGGPGFFLGSYPRCRARALDPESGRTVGPEFEAPAYHMHGLDGGPGGLRCGLHDVSVLAVVEGTAVVGRGSSSESGLAAYRDGEAPVWKIDVPGHLWLGQVLIEGTEAVVAWTDGQRQHRTAAVARIDLVTGEERWRRTFEAEVSEDGFPPQRIREVPGPAGHPRAILLPDPGHPRLLDAANGETLWEADRDGVALVAGESSDMLYPGNPGPDELIWFSPDGAVLATAPIPVPSHAVVAFAGGAAVLGAELESLDLVTFAGARRRFAIPPGNAFPVDDGLAVISSDLVLLVEPDGRVARYDAGTPWILARLDDRDGAIWLVKRPTEIVGVRVP